MLFPNRGDVVDAFGAYSQSLGKDDYQQQQQQQWLLDRFPPVEPNRPRLPMHKRKRSGVHSLEETSGKKRRGVQSRFPYDDDEAEREEAMKMLMEINHTGITLDDLLQLQRNSRQWNKSRKMDDDEPALVDAKRMHLDMEKVETIIPEEKSSLAAALTKSEDEEEERDGDLEYEDADAQGPDENDRVMGLAVKSTIKDEEEGKDKQDEADAAKTEDGEPALKDDPQFTKYFKMLKMGLPMDVVKHALKRDGQDPSIMDLDHSKSLKSQQGGGSDGDEVALKDDPDYEKVRTCVMSCVQLLLLLC